MMTSILIPEKFRDRWFSESFGADIQEKIRCAGNSILLDFTKCEWVDPIPALALICHFKQWSEKEKNTELSVRLGGASTLKDDKRILSRLFLSKHGFLRALADACPNTKFEYDSALDNFQDEFDASSLDLLDLAIAQSAHQRTLHYGIEPICPPMLFSSGSEVNATADFVDKAIKIMDAKLFSGRASEFPQRDSTLVRVRQVVTEIVMNAAEHAYDVDKRGPIALYARLRRHNDHLGLFETTGDCPVIDHLQDVTSGRYLELFICDIGHGLFHHVADWEKHGADEIKKIVKARRSPAENHHHQSLLSLISCHPVSRHPRNNAGNSSYRSNVTGLLHVNTVLRIRTDRSRIFVAPAWTAGPHPRPPDYNGGNNDRHFNAVDHKEDGKAPDGSFFQFAIAISHADLPVDGWLAPLPPKVTSTPRYQPQDAFRDCNDHPLSVLPTVFDLADRLTNNQTPQERSQPAIVSAFEQYLTDQGNVAVIRLSRDFRKNLTDGIVSRWLQYCSESLPFPPARTLAFCDLSRAQGVLLAKHLETVLFRKKEFPNIEKLAEPPFILILTEDLLARMLVIGNDQTGSYFKFSQGGLPEHTLLLHLIRTLRRFDSERFWEYVSNLRTRLLLPRVRWSTDDNGSEETYLPYYLDYSLAAQDRDLAKTVRRALRRLLAAFPDHRHVAIDDLIEPDLADAARWMQKPPKLEEAPSLFVISSVVTGSTVERELRHRGAPSAVAACFLVPSSPATLKDESCFEYFSALEWNPAPKTAQRDEYEWEREPGTPFVRPVVDVIDAVTNKPSRNFLIQPLARNFVDRGSDDSAPPSAAETYEEWHREGLLKTGHWIFGRRHGLVEINHLGALQMFADSAKGFYEWLLHELQTLTTNVPRPILTYSPGRLNAVMVRHLFKMRGTDGNPRLDKEKWQVVPINFLPDIGDGLKRLTQLTSDHIKKCKGIAGGTVLFLDVGYVGNRTFRHTRRQILALGAEHVIGFGLLNRTSSPALPGEAESSEVKCYWRMDVPSLDDQRSCPICRSLTAMAALRERIGQLRSIDSPCVKRISDDWDPADPNQAWEDYGLSPIELTKPLRKKFGFVLPQSSEELSSAKPPANSPVIQQSLWTETGEPNLPRTQPEQSNTWPSKEVTWKYVWLRDSAQATTYAIEIARTQAKPEYPLRLAKELAEPEGVPSSAFADIAAAVEVLSCYLLLCTHEISDAIKEALGIHLLQYLARLETMPPPEPAQLLPRHARLRELAALAFINLDAATKRLLQDEILSIMEKTLLLTPETRVAIMAVLFVSSGEVSPNQQASSFEQKATSRLQERDFRDTPSANTLRWNYWGLTLTEQQLNKQFDDALQFFGPGVRHNECICQLKKAENSADKSAGWRLCRTVFQIAHTLIFRRGPFTKDNAAPRNEPGELWHALCGTDLSDMQSIEKRIGTDQPPEKYQESIREVTSFVEAMRTTFHNALFRFDPDPEKSNNQIAEFARTIQYLVDAGIAQNVVATGIAETESNDQIRFNYDVSDFVLTDGNRYLLFGEELKTQISRLAHEAFDNSREERVAPPKYFSSRCSNKNARLWIGVSADKSGKVAVEFWNQGKDSTRADDFKRHQADLAPVHQQLRTSITRNISKADQNYFWFLTKIEFRWIQGGGS